MVCLTLCHTQAAGNLCLSFVLLDSHLAVKVSTTWWLVVVDRGATGPEFRPWLCHLLAVWHYRHTHFSCDIGTTITPASWESPKTVVLFLAVIVITVVRACVTARPTWHFKGVAFLLTAHHVPDGVRRGGGVLLVDQELWLWFTLCHNEPTRNFPKWKLCQLWFDFVQLIDQKSRVPQCFSENILCDNIWVKELTSEATVTLSRCHVLLGNCWMSCLETVATTPHHSPLNSISVV